jgi:hypothetical protein
MSTIYRKTEQGHDEIATRARRLVPRLRQALIVVDGKRTDDELCKLIAPPADEVLQALLEQGYIEVTSVTTVHVPLPAAPPPSSAPVVLTLDETRRRAARWLSDALGPFADSLNLRIERARKPEDMRVALMSASSFVRHEKGAAKAVEFEKHVGM